MPAGAEEWQQIGRPAAPSFLRERPQRHSATDDVCDPQWSEVAAVEGCRLVPVHEEDLTLAKRATALPDREQTAAAVMFAGRAHLDPVDDYPELLAANDLPRQRDNTLDERYAAREISAFSETGREVFRWERHHEIGDDQLVRWLHTIEANRDALGGIPDETRGGFRPDGRCHERGRARRQRQCAQMDCHGVSLRRLSQA